MIWPHMKSLLVVRRNILYNTKGWELLADCVGLPRPRSPSPACPTKAPCCLLAPKQVTHVGPQTHKPPWGLPQPNNICNVAPSPRSQRVEARRLPAALPTPFARSRAAGMPLVPPRTRTRDQLLPSDLPPPPFSSQHHRRWCYNCCSRTAFDLSHVVKNMLLLVLRQLFGGRLAVTTQGRPILGLLSR